MTATIASGESIPDIAGDVVVHVVRQLIRDLDGIDWALIRQGRETIQVASREVIEEHLRNWDELIDLAEQVLREHVQEVAK